MIFCNARNTEPVLALRNLDSFSIKTTFSDFRSRKFCLGLLASFSRFSSTARSKEAREDAGRGAYLIFRFPNYVVNIIFKLKFSNFVFKKLYFSNSMSIFQFLKPRSKKLLFSMISLKNVVLICIIEGVCRN